MRVYGERERRRESGGLKDREERGRRMEEGDKIITHASGIYCRISKKSLGTERMQCGNDRG